MDYDVVGWCSALNQLDDGSDRKRGYRLSRPRRHPRHRAPNPRLKPQFPPDEHPHDILGTVYHALGEAYRDGRFRVLRKRRHHPFPFKGGLRHALRRGAEDRPRLHTGRGRVRRVDCPRRGRHHEVLHVVRHREYVIPGFQVSRETVCHYLITSNCIVRSTSGFTR